jgi:predicted phage terminase large subunit-like protein
MSLVDFMGRQIDPQAQLLDLDRADCEESLYEFIKHSWHINDSAPWMDGWCIEAICEHLQAVVDGEIRRLIVNVPPRTGKSASCSISLCAWVWAQAKISHTSGPGCSFLYASFKDNLVTRDSVKCRRVIESDWYQALWGSRYQLTSDQNTKSRFTNDKGGYRITTSVEDKGATGEGANIIVGDDLNAAKQVESEAVIESTLDWWDGTMSTRLNNPKLGAFIEIQQRVGEKDITGHILSKNRGNWTHLMLPMRYEPERSYFTSIGWKDPRTVPGELLWPERFGEEEVAELESEMGAWRACGQLQQRPEPRGGGVIKRDWWKLWTGSKYPPMDFIIGCLDTAYTLKTLNDPSGMIVWGVFTPDEQAQSSLIYNRITKKLVSNERASSESVPNAMCMHAWTDRYEFHQLIEKTVQTARRMKVDLLLIENKAAGISVGQEIRRVYQNERFSVQFFDPKSQDKFARLVSIQHIFQEGLVCTPDTEWAEAVITQVGQFPRGSHDEYVDMTSMGLRYLRDNGLLQRAIEKHEEMESMKIYPGGREQSLYAV